MARAMEFTGLLALRQGIQGLAWPGVGYGGAKRSTERTKISKAKGQKNLAFRARHFFSEKQKVFENGSAPSFLHKNMQESWSDW